MKIILLLALIMTVGCSSMMKKETSTALTPTEMPMPTDPEIANAMMTANTEEMNMARLARTKAQNQEVKKFADMMFSEHAKNNDKVMTIRRKNNISLVETGASKQMKALAEADLEKMKMLKGKEFDTAYMDSQVSMHQQVLDKLDSSFIPHAQNAELKGMLQVTRESVKKHLEQAQSIRERL